MQHTFTMIMVSGVLGVVPLLSNPAHAQTARNAPHMRAAATSDAVSVVGCSRPSEAKEAKVIDFDATSSTAKLAVHLGSNRFKLVKIKVSDRAGDPRPLVPVIEAARTMQGIVQFYTPELNTDPESDHDSFLLMTEMGGGHVCWATSSGLINQGAPPVAEGTKPSNIPAASNGTPHPASEAKSADATAVSNVAPRQRSRTRVQPTLVQ
jgi:hypothetical protein